MSFHQYARVFLQEEFAQGAELLKDNELSEEENDEEDEGEKINFTPLPPINRTSPNRVPTLAKPSGSPNSNDILGFGDEM